MTILILTTIVGYLIGRFGHVYLNVWTGNVNWLPHHWIYGLILIILGTIYWQNINAQLIIFFGLGLLRSDLKDFINLKFFEPDKEGPKKFWNID